MEFSAPKAEQTRNRALPRNIRPKNTRVLAKAKFLLATGRLERQSKTSPNSRVIVVRWHSARQGPQTANDCAVHDGSLGVSLATKHSV